MWVIRYPWYRQSLQDLSPHRTNDPRSAKENNFNLKTLRS